MGTIGETVVTDSSPRQEIAAPATSRAEAVLRAIHRTQRWLLDRQQADGAWCAELEGDTILESETILLWAFLGREGTPQAQRAAAYLLEKQLPAGGWAQFPGGPVDPTISVKAYFALKLTGHDPQSEPLERARRAILAHGGADAVNTFTRFYLAMLGQIPYEMCPAVPPEIVLLPQWLPFNLYAASAWSRTIFVPLSVISAIQPVRVIEPARGIRELFLRDPADWPTPRCPGLPTSKRWLSLDGIFAAVDRGLKWCQRHRVLPWRRQALAAAKDWMLARFEHSDGLGAIYPPIVMSLVALRCLGHDEQSPPVRYCLKQLEDLAIEDPAVGSLRFQPCKSPVWDTAITLRALAVAGTSFAEPAIGRAVGWLLDRQTTRRGDWSKTVRAAPGGWYFEYANEFYPDVDDTLMALMALEAQFTDSGIRRCEAASGLWGRARAAVDRGLRWVSAMQNDDGGWAAFDRNNNRQFLCHVPFADHNAMIDPSTPDLTGRALEMLGKLGAGVGHPGVDRAVAYLRRSQEPDGSWFGRWGVNYIYGTWQALAGLVEVGVPKSDRVVAAGADWLLKQQQSCGGWGESPASYDAPELRGRGTPTASQTSWALLGLMAAGREQHPAVLAGVDYLLARQDDDGRWQESEFTGTGFPRVFYLRYHYYPIYFPLLALARWAAGSR
jgi:squalene-hopene/tetraprenyl-beta-curcumene cyclase